MKKIISSLIVASFVISCGTNHQSSMVKASSPTSVTTKVCDTFLTKSDKNQYFYASKEKTCFVGESAASILSGYNYRGNRELDGFGNISIFETRDGEFGAIFVKDEIAALLGEQNEVVPFIMAVVAADIGIISAWMLTDMYSK